MSMEITKKNINLATIYRPLNNFFLNPLMEYLEENMFALTKLKKVGVVLKTQLNFLKKVTV